MENPKFRVGWTPLHYACATSFEEVKRILESKEVDINVQTDYGVTPLMVATAVMFNFQIITHLVSQGANIGLKTRAGQVANDFLIFK